MNYLEIIIGAATIVYAIASVYFRFAKPELFRKLEPMKRVYGAKAGLAIHAFFYTIVPLVLGILLIRAGISGTSLF